MIRAVAPHLNLFLFISYPFDCKLAEGVGFLAVVLHKMMLQPRSALLMMLAPSPPRVKMLELLPERFGSFFLLGVHVHDLLFLATLEWKLNNAA